MTTQMKIQYFEETDTLCIVFKEAEIDETRDLDENTLVEFDAQGNLVSMTLEHDREWVAHQTCCSDLLLKVCGPLVANNEPSGENK